MRVISPRQQRCNNCGKHAHMPAKCSSIRKRDNQSVCFESKTKVRKQVDTTWTWGKDTEFSLSFVSAEIVLKSMRAWHISLRMCDEASHILELPLHNRDRALEWILGCCSGRCDRLPTPPPNHEGSVHLCGDPQDSATVRNKSTNYQNCHYRLIDTSTKRKLEKKTSATRQEWLRRNY